VDYSLVKAKFWLLFPTAVRSRPYPLKSLPESAIAAQVDAAIHNMAWHNQEQQKMLLSRIQYYFEIKF
jgi:hypothetical protein